MKKILLSIISVLCLFTQAKADDAFTLTATNATVTENFDGMWNAAQSEATLTMPNGWRMERQMGAPRMVGAYSAAATELMYAGGVSLASNAKNGTWNFGSSTNPSDRAVGGLSTTVDGGTRCVSVMTQLINGGIEPVNQLTISYDIEKYRKGDNEAGFTVQMYYSLDGRNWTSAGNDFCTTFAADAATEGYATVPGDVRAVSAVLGAKMQPGVDFYLAWNITVTSGDNAAGAMALAIDNFQLTGELPAIPTARHYIYAIDETGYDALGLYAWGDGELFGAWPGESWVDQKTIDDKVYKVFLLDAESGSYNLIFNNWNNGQQVPDFNITANRDYYLRVTATGVTEIGGSAGIVETKNQPAVVSPFVYDLQGRKVGTADGRLPQGLYIVNGKKSIIR